MIRVLHIVNSMNRGGIENLIMNIYRNIDRSKVQFDFLTHSDQKQAYSDEILALGGRIYSVPSRRKGLLKNKKALDSFFKNHTEYSIVHSHQSSLSYIEPLIAATKNNVPVRIVHSHSSSQSGLKINKYIHFFNRKKIKDIANYFIAVSSESARWLYGENFSGKVITLKNGIEVDKYIYNDIRRKQNRETLGFDEDTLVIGHVGRFTYAKNHKFLIDIFKEIKHKYKNSRLILVGDGELKNTIDIYIEDKKLVEDVTLTGEVSDVPKYLEVMDLLVFPSHFEGFPLVIVEAQASGLKSYISDKISDEVKLTELVTSLPIEKTASEWADEILNSVPISTRQSESTKIKESGFDIKDTTNQLMRLYTELL